MLGVSLSRRCPHVGGACLSTPKPVQLAPLCPAWGRPADTLAVAGGKRVVAPGPQRLALRAATCAFSLFILNLPSFHCQEPGKPWLCRLWGQGWARSNREGLWSL